MPYEFFYDLRGDAVWFQFANNLKESYGKGVADDSRILHYNELGEQYAVTFLDVSTGVDVERDLTYVPEEHQAKLRQALEQEHLILTAVEAEKVTR